MENKKNRLRLGCFLVALIFAAYISGSTFNNAGGRGGVFPTRSVALTQSRRDASNLLEGFDDAEIRTEDSVFYFSGSKTANVSGVNETAIGGAEETVRIDFDLSYAAGGVMTVSARCDEGVVIDNLQGFAFTDEKGEIDILFYANGETVTLGDLRAVLGEDSALDNVGFFDFLGKVFETAVSVLAVAVAATVVVVLAPVVVAAAGISFVAQAVKGASNAAVNSEQRLEYPNDGGYIYDQSALSNWRYGWGTVAEYGCGAIAAYNVMRMLGRPQSFVDVIYNFEVGGIELALGYLGSNPFLIGTNYFLPRGIPYAMHVSPATLQWQAERYYDCNIIISYFNGSTAGDGAHIAAIKKIGNNYYGYNTQWAPAYKADEKGSISAFMSGMGAFIAGYIVG